MPTQSLQIDPRLLRLRVTRLAGADPAKLQRQIAQHGKSLAGMPPQVVVRGADGGLIIYDGVTRATRAAKLLLGAMVPVDVIGVVADIGGNFPTVLEKLP